MAAVKEIILSDPQEDFITSTCELNLFMAGVGSGKTHVIALLSADFVKNHPHMVGLIATNTHQQLAKVTLKRVFDIWAEVFGWRMDTDYVVNKMPPRKWTVYGEKLESYDKTICFSNGAVIFTASLENYTAIDGTEFGWEIIDETKDTREVAVKDVLMPRLRQNGMYINKDGEIIHEKKDGYVGWNPCYITTSPAKVEWLNEMFDISDQETIEEIHKHIFSKTEYFSREKDGKKVVISSTYHNEENLPENYIPNLLSRYAGNENRINMLIYGSPVAKTGGEYVSGFDRMKTVKTCDLLPDIPIHISFDFNAIFVTILCYQIVRTGAAYQVRYFDEICLESPRNTTEAACLEFRGRYFEGKPNVGLFFTGDASGKNRTHQSNEHAYQTIERILRAHISSSSNRTITRNPLLIPSRDFVNKCHAGGFPQLEIVISPRCKRLINDCEFLKQGPDGGYIKQMVEDKNTGKKYEKNGHLYDAHKYSLIASFETLYNQ